MTIKVLASHIKRGKRRECSLCPIALAITRQLKPTNPVKVDNEDVFMDGKYYRLPTETRRFITNFDAGRKCKPFSFELYR